MNFKFSKEKVIELCHNKIRDIHQRRDQLKELAIENLMKENQTSFWTKVFYRLTFRKPPQKFLSREEALEECDNGFYKNQDFSRFDMIDNQFSDQEAFCEYLSEALTQSNQTEIELSWDQWRRITR